MFSNINATATHGDAVSSSVDSSPESATEAAADSSPESTADGVANSTAETTPPPDPERRVKVGVGDLAIVTDGATLTTSGLGSCVAVAIGDPRTDVRGLLHAMLPTAGRVETPAPRPAKYVDSGIETLIAELVDNGASSRRLEARIAGGAEMLNLTDAVGPRNVDRVQVILEAADVPIVAADVGDTVGRTVRFRADGTLAVRAADGFERTI